MSKSRAILKKLVYRLFGPKAYLNAYARGKVADIRSGKNLEAEARFLKHFVDENATVLDIGANYGHYTATLAALAKNGKVYAYEPIPFTYKVLQKVIARLSFSNVVLRHAAVSDREGIVQMSVPLLDFGGPNTGVAFIGNDHRADVELVDVKTIRLDDELKMQVDFIKIDIEGHEPVAFKGMEALIKKSRPVVLIEFSHSCLTRAGFEPSNFASYLSNELGYCFSKIQGDLLRIINSDSPPDGYYFLIPVEKVNRYDILAAL